VSLLLGAMMVTGIAFIVASVSKDMMSVIGWGTVALLVLVIPALAAMFPGAASRWIKIIPSYFLVDILRRAINFNIGWGGNIWNVMALVCFNIVFIAVGIAVLKRKLA
jgi:ABC-2 type transport system permease protein